MKQKSSLFFYQDFDQINELLYHFLEGQDKIKPNNKDDSNFKLDKSNAIFTLGTFLTFSFFAASIFSLLILGNVVMFAAFCMLALTSIVATISYDVMNSLDAKRESDHNVIISNIEQLVNKEEDHSSGR